MFLIYFTYFHPKMNPKSKFLGIYGSSLYLKDNAVSINTSLAHLKIFQDKTKFLNFVDFLSNELICYIRYKLRKKQKKFH